MHVIHQTDSVVVIATKDSSNPKTGNGIQIWILDARMHPAESRQTGADAKNQCSDCVFASGNGCYVSVNPLGSIFRAWQRGRYTPLIMGTPEWQRFFSGKFVRFGAYGNPSLLPLPMVESIATLSRRFTGYFHNWKSLPASEARAYGKFFMASCEESNIAQAQSLGLRTFAVVSQPVAGAGIECLSDTRGMQCKDCGLCDGTFRRGGALPSVYIKAHGYQVKKAISATSGAIK